MLNLFERARLIKHSPHKKVHNNVLYVMWRDVRVRDNYALVFGQLLARQHGSKFAVANFVQAPYLQYGQRHYKFYLEGLESVYKKLDSLNISLIVNRHDFCYRDKFISDIIHEHGVGFVVFDFNPLPYVKNFVQRFVDDNKENDFCVYMVDAHNVVPCWLASDKKEYSARTFRGKVLSLMGAYIDEGEVRREKITNRLIAVRPFERELTFGRVMDILKSEAPNKFFDFYYKNFPWINKDSKLHSMEEIDSKIVGGEEAAEKMLINFIDKKLPAYHALKNDPNADSQSHLSPYLNFGHLSATTVCKKVHKLKNKHKESVALLIEQLVVRKELSDNFFHYSDTKQNCLYNLSPEWARNNHRKFNDEREHIYDLIQLENSQTADPLWNAANNQMRQTGLMHGYLRMYWAKRMITWTENFETALSYSVYLNDKYSLDGNDVNGLVGCLWSVCALHDRPFYVRPIFGNIRSMTAKGVRSKFDAEQFIIKYANSNNNNRKRS